MTTIQSIASPYGLARGNRSLCLLLSGQGLSSLADWLLVVVLTVMVQSLSKAVLAVSLLGIARVAPYALVLPWSGLLLDRMDRRLLMTALGVGRAACMLGLLTVHSQATLPLVFPLAFLSAAFSCLLRPTVNATLPALVGEQNTVVANSLVGQIDGLAHILGPAFAAAFIATHSTRLALCFTACAFLFSGLAFYLTSASGNAASQGAGLDFSAREVLVGFQFILRENAGVLVALACATAGLALLAGAYYVLAVQLCTRTFGLGQQGVGWLDATYGVGGLLGGLLIGAIMRGRRVSRLFIGGTALNALGLLLLSISPPGAAAFFCMVVLGTAGVVITVSGTTILQSASPADMLGRTFTAFEAILVVATLAGSGAAGLLVPAIGPRGATGAFAVFGAILLLVSLPRLLALEDVLGIRIFLRGVPLLAGVPRHLLDSLAAHFETVTVDAGTFLVREGDQGDRLYIVRSGEVEVLLGGRTVRKLRSGRYFGEIALLRSVPRTASVRATTPTTLYSLEREIFHQLVQQVDDLRPRLVNEAERQYVFRSPSSVLNR